MVERRWSERGRQVTRSRKPKPQPASAECPPRQPALTTGWWFVAAGALLAFIVLTSIQAETVPVLEGQVRVL